MVSVFTETLHFLSGKPGKSEALVLTAMSDIFSISFSICIVYLKCYTL